jgi:hypothetical protein
MLKSKQPKGLAIFWQHLNSLDQSNTFFIILKKTEREKRRLLARKEENTGEYMNHSSE